MAYMMLLAIHDDLTCTWSWSPRHLLCSDDGLETLFVVWYDQSREIISDFCQGGQLTIGMESGSELCSYNVSAVDCAKNVTVGVW